MAETSIAKARRLAKEKREKRETEEAAAAEAESKAAEPAAEEESGLLASIRRAFSSADDISRIDAAVDAVTDGVSQADKDSKRKKK